MATFQNEAEEDELMRQLTGFLAGMFLAVSAFAAQDVAVSGAWVRATAPGQDSAMVSMEITSRKDARLVAVEVGKEVADKAQIHTMREQNGMMIMREVDSMPLPAGHEVSLGSGDHIMLIGLKHLLKAGDSVPLKLTVELAGKHRETVKVNAEVRKFAPHEMNDMHDMGGMRDGH
jgi:periplasmic copper chaperone A